MFNLRCYNGGFALKSMLSGSAVLVVCVDSFQDASDAVTANAELDVLDENVISFVKTAMDTEEEFDLIVLDPLKLTTSISSLDKASWSTMHLIMMQ